MGLLSDYYIKMLFVADNMHFHKGYCSPVVSLMSCPNVEKCAVALLITLSAARSYMSGLDDCLNGREQLEETLLRLANHKQKLCGDRNTHTNTHVHTNLQDYHDVQLCIPIIDGKGKTGKATSFLWTSICRMFILESDCRKKTKSFQLNVESKTSKTPFVALIMPFVALITSKLQ